MSDNTADVTLERILELKGNDTQDAFGKKIKMSQANVSKMLKGTPPSAATLIEIAKAYHVSVDWLLGLSEQKEHTSNLDVSNLTYSDVMAVIDKLYENGTIQMGYDYNSYGNESDPGMLLVQDKILLFLWKVWINCPEIMLILLVCGRIKHIKPFQTRLFFNGVKRLTQFTSRICRSKIPMKPLVNWQKIFVRGM